MSGTCPAVVDKRRDCTCRTAAQHYAQHQADGRSFIIGRPGCWFSKATCVVVTTPPKYCYSTSNGFTCMLEPDADATGFIIPCLSAHNAGCDSDYDPARMPWTQSPRRPGSRSRAADGDATLMETGRAARAIPITLAVALQIQAERHTTSIAELSGRYGRSIAVIRRIVLGIHPVFHATLAERAS